MKLKEIELQLYLLGFSKERETDTGAIIYESKTQTVHICVDFGGIFYRLFLKKREELYNYIYYSSIEKLFKELMK